MFGIDCAHFFQAGHRTRLAPAQLQESRPSSQRRLGGLRRFGCGWHRCPALLPGRANRTRPLD